MKLSRRNLIQLGITNTVLTLTPKLLWASQKSRSLITKNRNIFQLKNRKPLSILQGATCETKTQFSIAHNKDLILNCFALGDNNQKIVIDHFKLIEFGSQPIVISKFYFSGLEKKVDYQLVITNEGDGSIIDIRTFRTLNLSSPQLRFAICSCMHDEQHEPLIWEDLIHQNPDIIFFIGDSVYTDSEASSQNSAILDASSPDRLWRRFSEARSTLKIYHSPRLIPIVATWDDHDFGQNDTNSIDYPYVIESQFNFTSFFAQDESHCSFLKRGPGISSSLNLGNHLIFLLDDRSFRKSRGSNDRYAHWGKEQESWMLNLMRVHQGPTWIMNGSQIFPSMPFKESVSAEHKEQLSGFLNELRKINSKAIFTSGDVHFSEISKVYASETGYPTYEITSSSVHSLSVPGAPGIFPNQRRIASTGQRNYIIVEAISSEFGAQFKVKSHSKLGIINFENQYLV